ncbi:DUF488 family protein [Candidatus Poriferisodalis sp.]|uniref:DUF488 domain-containing protein n=1 Tax=Candidatus Poriferisodalis sp. TaxID=3101277 RepID=UPI003B0173B2
MPNSQTQIFTIGHSNHSASVFISMLQQHRIDAVADVRSAPYSRFVSQFDRKSLGPLLDEANVAYVYVGEELGGRPSDPELYDPNGHACYRRMAQTESFENGLERILEGSSRYRLALMCSEEDPLQCHRTLLVAHELWQRDVHVSHIRACRETGESRIETHTEALERLVQMHDLNQGMMIASDGGIVDQLHGTSAIYETAVERQREQVAYTSDRKPSVSGEVR